MRGAEGHEVPLAVKARVNSIERRRLGRRPDATIRESGNLDPGASFSSARQTPEGAPMSRSTLSIFLSSLLLTTLVTAATFAQEAGGGSLGGTVLDSLAAAVPGAQV